MTSRNITVFYLTSLCVFALAGCQPTVEKIHIRPDFPVATTAPYEPGLHSLGLGETLPVNGELIFKDGWLFVPDKIEEDDYAAPLLVWLHGGGGDADNFKYATRLANEFGIVVLSLDARHNTWDGIDSRFGPDVVFIEKALNHVLSRLPIDMEKMALAGLSDGGSYSLAIGRVNGELFTHLAAVAPGYLGPPCADSGSPKIFIAHGLRDTVYPIMGTRHWIVPKHQKAGYDVTYMEFDGPHWAVKEVVESIFSWLVNGREA